MQPTQLTDKILDEILLSDSEFLRLMALMLSAFNTRRKLRRRDAILQEFLDEVNEIVHRRGYHVSL